MAKYCRKTFFLLATLASTQGAHGQVTHSSDFSLQGVEAELAGDGAPDGAITGSTDDILAKWTRTSLPDIHEVIDAVLIHANEAAEKERMKTQQTSQKITGSSLSSDEVGEKYFQQAREVLTAPGAGGAELVALCCGRVRSRRSTKPASCTL